MKRLEPFLWMTGLVLFSTVLTHWTRVWRGRSVPSFADYVDFVGLMGVMIAITVAVGIFRERNWRQRQDPLVGAFRLLILFPLKVVFLLIIPAVYVGGWLRGVMDLGQRALLYAGVGVIATAGFLIARRLRKAKQLAAAAAKPDGG